MEASHVWDDTGEGATTVGQATMAVTTDTWGFSNDSVRGLWEQCHTLIASRDWYDVCHRGTVDKAQRMFPRACVQPTPLWDAEVFADEELVGGLWSHPAAPALDDSARARRGFQLPYTEWATFFDTHLHGPYLVNAAAVGMSVLCTMPAQASVRRNPHFGDVESKAVDDWIALQVSQDKVHDVTDATRACGVGSVPPFVGSPLSCAAKPSELPGPPKVRVCGNMSAGGSGSVNAHINFSPDVEPVGLMTVESVARRIRFLRALFPGVKLYGIKIDLSQAFRNLQAQRRVWWSMGMTWKGRRYAHTHVMWGSRSASHLMALVTSAVCDILARQGIWVDCFLDDFVSIQASVADAEAAAVAIRAALATLGLVESVEKYVGPTQQLVVLGVLFNLASGEITVTESRRTKTIATLVAYLQPAAEFTEREVQQLAGRLFFMGSVIPWSRPRVFALWRWIAQWSSGGPGQYTERKAVPAECRVAIQWWLDVLSMDGGLRSLHLQAGIDHAVSLLVGLASDASDYGFGAIMSSQRWYIGGKWAPWETKQWSINLRELLAVTFATITFGPHLSGHIVRFRVDNTTAHYAMCNSGADNIFLRFLVHVLARCQELYRFRLVSEWVDTLSIGPPDPLSRGLWPDGWLMESVLSPGSQAWAELRVHTTVRALFGDASGPSLGSSQALSSFLQQHWCTGTSFDEFIGSGTFPGLVATDSLLQTAHLMLFT